MTYGDCVVGPTPNPGAGYP